MKLNLKKNNFWILSFIALVFISTSLVLAGEILDSYRVNHENSVIKTAISGITYAITNYSPIKDYFIPNRTIEEWTAVKNAADTYLDDISITRPLRIVISPGLMDGNFENDDPILSWWESADLHCQNQMDAIPAYANSNWKALLWQYPLTNTNFLSLRPNGPVTFQNRTYIGRDDGIMFTAAYNNDVPTTISAPPDCDPISCDGNVGVWTGRAAGCGSSRYMNCENWSYNIVGSGGTAVRGYSEYEYATKWLTGTTPELCWHTQRIYCVEQPESPEPVLPEIEISTDELDFGEVNYKEYATLDFTIYNNSSWDVEINLKADNGDFDYSSCHQSKTGDVFSLVNDPNITIPANTSQEYTIQFRAGVDDSYNTTLNIATSHPVDTSFSVSLIGQRGSDRRILSSNLISDGDLEGIDPGKTWWESANDLCSNLGGPYAWKALVYGDVSGTATLPQTVTHAGTPYIISNGGTIFTAIADNDVPFNLIWPIGSAVYQWTGINTNTGEAMICSDGEGDWNSNVESASNFAAIGRADYSDYRWLYNSKGYCNNEYRVYCVEQDE